MALGHTLDLAQGLKDCKIKVYLITGRYERGVGKGRALDLALPASIYITYINTH